MSYPYERAGDKAFNYFIVFLVIFAIFVIGFVMYVLIDNQENISEPKDFCESHNDAYFELPKTCFIEEDRKIIGYKIIKFQDEWRLVE